MTTSPADRAGERPAADAELDQLASDFERLMRLLRRATAPDGLSLTAASVLSRLDDLGPHRLSDLAVAEGVTQPAMTQLVSRLERCGFAERAGDPADGRVVLVRATAAGRDRIRERRRARAAKLRELLAGLPDEDRAALERSLRTVDRLAGPANDRPAGRVGEHEGGTTT
ncbi:MarR family winged helix-turn-helix transcriptional regulator [Plantactinospora siamensis]|uniref:MarR family winged helix-turn-helix transcriptional regulator n=1 Tax=Plantactinospora siamensis TaxID=555372 RepID=A0ABV6P2M0_9ACTN